MLFPLTSFGMGIYVDSGLEEAYNKKLEIIRGYTTINMAVKLNNALTNDMITNTSEFKPMFMKRLDIQEDKTTRDSFTTALGDKYTIIPLRQTCETAASVERKDVRTACAKIIMEIQGVNKKFELMLYPDGVFPPYNSKLYTLLNSY